MQHSKEMVDFGAMIKILLLFSFQEHNFHG
jgi:hypothetical protein